MFSGVPKWFLAAQPSPGAPAVHNSGVTTLWGAENESMHILARIARHARITRKNFERAPSPPFLILFINSTCNQKCEHCFYWRNLNRNDDLTMEEMVSLSRSLGRIENLNLSGGEPFLRKEFAKICLQFIRHNKVRQIYVPTNAYLTERIVTQVEETLREKELARISHRGVGRRPPFVA